MKQTGFNLAFKDEPDLGDWEIRLITDVSMHEEEIEELVLRYAKRTAESDISPSPVSIMDLICAEHPGWRWEDMDYNSIEITDWKQ